MPVHAPPPTTGRRRWAAVTATLPSPPMCIALLAVTGVWAAGAIWSYTEQKAFAGGKSFVDPALLPLVLDGFAIAMACVAFAASLDGRPAIPARLATVVGVAASAASNGVWAAQRSTGVHGPDMVTVAIGVSIPIAANIAFEVLLAELRRQVQRNRGLPAPVAVPSLRLIRLVLAPLPTFREWRTEVLALTAHTPADPQQWGGPGEVTSTPEIEAPTTLALEASTGEHDAGPDEVKSVAEPVRLHAVDAPMDAGVDDIRTPGARRTWRQARPLAQELGVTRRADWSVGDLNAAIDERLREQEAAS